METDIQVIYEDDVLVAVNKPAGLVVHSDGRTSEPTLVDWIIAQYPDVCGVGEPLVLSDGTEIKRPGIVHRLDRDTSGVLVIAKTQDVFNELKRAFQEKRVEKTYRAIVHGTFTEKSGTVDIPIGKSKQDFRKWVASEKARGTLRDARTDYTVRSQVDALSYIECFPRTGRTHQIRVHMKAVGHPILCDPLYGKKGSDCDLISRQALHAWRLTIPREQGGSLTLEAPLPEDMNRALTASGLQAEA